MSMVTLCFSVDGQAAAIDFHGRRTNDLPITAINQALATLYKIDDLAPYLYEVYNGPDCLGLLVAGNFNPDNDTQIRVVFDSIIFQNTNAPLTGELMPYEIPS